MATSVDKWVIWDRQLDAWTSGYFYSLDQAMGWLAANANLVAEAPAGNFYPLLWETKNP